MKPSLIRIYCNKKMLTVLLVGFASGLPLSLVGSTLQARMSDAKIDITLIGIFSLISIPYSFKFLWAPVMDRYVPRFLGLPFLGKRRGWIFITQIILVFAMIGMAFSDPSTALTPLTVFSLAVAFFGASQDVVIDAYKIELLPPEEFGAGAAMATLGYRLAMLFSGAIALILADRMSWQSVYLLMAASMAVFSLVTILSPTETHTGRPPRTLREAVAEPLADFFKRQGAWEILTFITLYKLDVVFTLALMTKFFLELGFTKTEIGAVAKGFGLVAALTGTMCGGIWMARLGLHRSLWIFALLQGISGFCFYLLAVIGHHYPMLVLTITAENFFSGMGNAVYLGFIMSLCNPSFTATQYALFSSLQVITRSLAGIPSGWVVKSFGWANYYLIGIALMVPSLLLLTRYRVWHGGLAQNEEF